MTQRGGGRLRPITPLDAIAAQWRPTTDAVPARSRPSSPIPQPVYAGPVEPPEQQFLPFDPVSIAEANLGTVQGELDALKTELNLLRRRDETLKFYMSRLDEELRLAARLQQDFLPKLLPQLGPVHFHTLFRPAGYVSGDLYDLMRLDEHHVGFFVVDAVGHGMPAALLTMFIKRALVCKETSTDGYRLLEPAETMRRLNSALVEQNLSAATFATAVYGIIDVRTLQLTLATGGHPSPLLQRGDQTIEVQAEGPLLGIFDNETFTQATAQLQPRDRLFVYSDGLEVAFGEDVAAQQGKWRQELYARRTLPAEGLLIDLSDHLDREAGSLQPKDDLTLVMVEIK